MAQQIAIPREQSSSKVVTDEYGFKHTLHINDETGGTHLKHSGENESLCPYCNEDRDYGYGVQVPDGE